MAQAAVLGVTLALGAALASCSPFGGGVFVCASDEQCVGGGPDGRCELEVGACSFADDACASGRRYGHLSGPLASVCVGDEGPGTPDAGVDAPPAATCTPGETACAGHALETCNADGTGFDPALRVACPLTCSAGECVAASNLAAADQAACGPGAPALVALAGATVTIGPAQISCTSCAGGVTTIPRTGATPNSWYCLSELAIPAGVTVTYAPGHTTGVTLFVAAAATLGSPIDFRGGDATAAAAAGGAPGPGGFAGGARSNDNAAGNTGAGPCAGGGGGTGGMGGDRAGGGGGGGGHRAAGGAGGTGRTGGGANIAGGTAGAGCDSAELRPLAGGSGGGGGGDGACGQGTACGWPGGGGGGALHVASRVSISATAALVAAGGDGYGADQAQNGVGGGGGGGAGGGLLLEAPALALTGPLVVDGGDGGAARDAANGGAGATGGTDGGAPGPSAAQNSRGGGGGGGGGGRIRLNGGGGSCAMASPAGSCSTGGLRTAP